MDKTDKVFFDQYVSAADIIYANSAKKILLVDRESHIKFLSPFFCKDINLKSSDIIGNSYDSIPQIKPLAGACLSEDMECLELNSTLKFITLHNHNGESSLFYKTKSPIVDVQKNVVGIQIEFEPVTAQINGIRSFIDQHLLRFNSSALRIVDVAAQRDFNINNLSKPDIFRAPTLTETEQLILFLLLMYDKPKIITNIVNQVMSKDVSVSTIRNIIHQQLMVKFAVTGTQELIDKAISMGYETKIPSVIARPFSLRV